MLNRLIAQYTLNASQNAVPKAMTIAEIQEASEKDKTVRKIRECIEKNKWTKEGELKPYFIVRKDLTHNLTCMTRFYHFF
jgi:hypothetical protein